jgi:hypothetical protein
MHGGCRRWKRTRRLSPVHESGKLHNPDGSRSLAAIGAAVMLADAGGAPPTRRSLSDTTTRGARDDWYCIFVMDPCLPLVFGARVPVFRTPAKGIPLSIHSCWVNWKSNC